MPKIAQKQPHARRPQVPAIMKRRSAALAEILAGDEVWAASTQHDDLTAETGWGFIREMSARRGEAQHWEGPAR